MAEVFQIDPSSIDGWEKSDLLVDLFVSREASEKQEYKSDLCHSTLSADAPSTSSVEIAADQRQHRLWFVFHPSTIFYSLIYLGLVHDFLLVGFWIPYNFKEKRV